VEEVKAVAYPKKGIDAYNFKNTKENHIGTGGYGNVFRATRKYDNRVIAIKQSI